MQYQLYHFEACPFCAKVRKAIHLMQIEIELIDVKKQPEKREELLLATGKTQVPCLKSISPDTTKWLHESDDIIAYMQQNLQVTALV